MFRMRHELESSRAGTPRIVKCIFHNSFPELEDCAKRGCATCRVFQRALWLRQLTKQEADRLGNPLHQDLNGLDWGLPKLEAQQTTQAKRFWK